MKTENRAWIGLGSNIGDGMLQLSGAWQRLGEFPEITLEAISSPWQSEPVDMESENWFINAVGRLKTTLQPEELFHALQVVENDFGRVREQKALGHQDRTLDLDLLYFGEKAELQMSTKNLVVPHTHIPERLFVLKPLQEIDPELLDVNTGEKVSSMIRRLQSKLEDGEQKILKSEWQGSIEGAL